MNRLPVVGLALAAILLPLSYPRPAAAQDAAPAADPKEAKIRRLLEAMKWKEQFLGEISTQLTKQEEGGALPKGFAKKFLEVADVEGLLKVLVGAYAKNVDEATLDAAIAFYETPAGQKFASAQIPVARAIMENVQGWAMAASMKTMEAMGGMGAGGAGEEAEGEEEMAEEGDGEMGEEEAGEEVEEVKEEEGGSILDRLKKAKVSANEVAAIATLRNLAVCQAQVQFSEKIDADGDGIGEYGTFLELTGSVPVRKGTDFSKAGTKIYPAIMSSRLAEVDGDGVVRKSGYCFRIFLPDGAKQAGFVHETGPKEKVGLAGGTGAVGVDLSETTWCAYAWPEKRGETGNRAFFINQAADVMQSSNDRARWEGAKAPAGNAAFRADGITALVAVGTAGRDGDVWKVTN